MYSFLEINTSSVCQNLENSTKGWLCSVKMLQKKYTVAVHNKGKYAERCGITTLELEPTLWSDSHKNWNLYNEQRRIIYRGEEVSGSAIWVWHVSYWNCLHPNLIETDLLHLPVIKTINVVVEICDISP